MPRIDQPQEDKPKHQNQGPWQWSYSFVFNASDEHDRRACETKMFDYLDARSQADPTFKAAVWQHFGDDHPCGKHNVVGDHYHG